MLLSPGLREASFARNLDLLREIEGWPGEATATVGDVLAERDAARRDRAGGADEGGAPAAGCLIRDAGGRTDVGRGGE
ncbi:hypothetical protein [Streptomyces hoynatensis]|uniref:hypothetical protein n=1 Tax=Streptomyces hoynatensis TaxID=1141874 RepID=UPI0011C36A17|nr:hypothetical protein [Streptomyces hoynatensis]